MARIVNAKQEPGLVNAKQEPGLVNAKQEPGLVVVKQEPGLVTVKREPGSPSTSSTLPCSSRSTRRIRAEPSDERALETAKKLKKEEIHAIRTTSIKSEGMQATSAASDDDDKLAVAPLLEKWAQLGNFLKVSSDEPSPYAQSERPSPFEALYVRDLLAALHGEPERDQLEENCSGQGTLLEKRARSVLDSLVRTILSQNTTDALSKRAFENLKATFPTYKQLLAAPRGEVEASIKFAGLSEMKVGRIRVILETVLKEKPEACKDGEPSLEFLRAMTTEEIKAYLGAFKGVGPKTIACVLLFTIGHDDFAVDTHVWHIAKRLGWVPPSATREMTYAHLNTRIPDCIKYSLHVLLVLHGKKCISCCKGHTQLPPDGPCPLGQLAKVRGALAGLAADAAMILGVTNEAKSAAGECRGKGKKGKGK